MQQCAANSGTISCSLYTNIFNRAVTRGSAVHSLATGISTTSLTGTRDWLLSNILQATDEYSYALSENMTSLVRQNFRIDDRVNKAWFVNPANRWNIPMTNGYQSDLLLSDKLIIIAMITLNDGAGNILRRRLMSFSSPSGSGSAASWPMLHSSEEAGAMGDNSPAPGARSLLQTSSLTAATTTQTGEQGPAQYISVPLKAPQSEPDEAAISEALSKIMQEPRAGTLPAMEFNVNIPAAVSKLYSVEDKPTSVLEFIVYGRFDEKMGLPDAIKQIGDEFHRRMETHMTKYCPVCERIAPVFNNLQKYGVLNQNMASQPQQQQRRLLQAAGPGGIAFGTYSVILVYNPALLKEKNFTAVFLSDIQNSVYSKEYTVVWQGGKDYTNQLSTFLSDLKNNQFIIGDLKALEADKPNP